MLVRLHEAGVKAVEWQAGAEGDYQNRRTLASIILVSADYVGNCSGQFLSYAALLARQGVLRRVVVDECHVAITADSWRTALRKLKDVCLLPCQHLSLTATLPPSLKGQLRETMLMPGATVLRAETTQRRRSMPTACGASSYGTPPSPYADGRSEVLALRVAVRVRWVDHKCKVNSDEFDEEETIYE